MIRVQKDVAPTELYAIRKPDNSNLVQH